MTRQPADCYIAILQKPLSRSGLYKETEYKKVGMITGDEYLLIAPVEFYTDFILAAGIGYVLLMPAIGLLPKIKVVDERIISRTLREIGLVGWTGELRR